MAIEIKMPALSPTMEKGTLAKWLVGVGDTIKSGDLLAEIETDKATMEFEAIDEGTITELCVAEGTEDVPVGTVIARVGPVGAAIATPADVQAAPVAPTPPVPVAVTKQPEILVTSIPIPQSATLPSIKATPLARRLAVIHHIDLKTISGTGPAGRITRRDLGLSAPIAAIAPSIVAAPPQSLAIIATEPRALGIEQDIPHEVIKLTGMRKTIARRLTESKQQVPHIYLTVDVRLDALIALRVQLNAALEPRGIKLSINDLIVKAQALSLMEVPECNVSFGGDVLVTYGRADISVAVSIPGGLITPIIIGADSKSLSAIASETKALVAKARDGKLQPSEYQGGTASLSNMGMFGIREFAAVINPPQAMILAVGVAEQRPHIVGGEISIATMMSVTGSFDHRAIDGADGARFMNAFKKLVESPTTLIA
jgi:pyruvate dehydrogenase E2 component (dihydrolipoamide acetyltransferase)